MAISSIVVFTSYGAAYRLLISFMRAVKLRTRRISNSKLISIAAAKLKLFSQKPVKIRQTCSVRLSERTSAFRAEKNGSTPLPNTAGPKYKGANMQVMLRQVNMQVN